MGSEKQEKKMEGNEEIDPGMIVTLIIMAVFIILALVFCVVYYYRKLVAKWNYWDDPENDTWRQEMGQEQVSPAPQWKSLLAEGTIQNLSRGSCGRKGRPLKRKGSIAKEGEIGTPNHSNARDPERIMFRTPSVFRETVSHGREDEQFDEEEDIPKAVEKNRIVKSKNEKTFVASESKKIKSEYTEDSKRKEKAKTNEQAKSAVIGKENIQSLNSQNQLNDVSQESNKIDLQSARKTYKKMKKPKTPVLPPESMTTDVS